MLAGGGLELAGVVHVALGAEEPKFWPRRCVCRVIFNSKLLSNHGIVLCLGGVDPGTHLHVSRDRLSKAGLVLV